MSMREDISYEYSNSLYLFFFFAALSLVIKLALVLYQYFYGYLPGDISLITPDGFTYAQESSNNTIIYVGGHWLYNYLNQIAYGILGDTGKVYIAMSVFNALLSLSIPVAMLPALKALVPKEKLASSFIFLTVFSLFWPTSLWVASLNLKDTLLATLFAFYISLFMLSTNNLEKKKTFLLFIMQALVLFLIFSLRSYLAAFLLFAGVAHILFRQKNLYLLIFILIFLILVFVSPFGQFVLQFLNVQNNWLINPDVLNKMDQGDLYIINRNIGGFFAGIIKTNLNPFPTLEIENIYSLLAVQRTIIVSLLLYYFLYNLFFKWKSKYKFFLILNFILPMIFYSYVENFSGPRQIYSNMDIIFILCLSCFVAYNKRKQEILLSICCGIFLCTVLLFYTSRSFII